MGSNFITGLDVGTSSIKVAIAENKNGKAFLRGIFKEPSSGLRKGAIVDLAEVSQAISRAISNVKKISKAAAKNIYVNIGTPQVKIQQSRGIVAVSRADNEIYQDDIEKVKKASQAINLPPNRTIIHNVTREFIVDGVGDILDPIGLSGSRLEVNSLVMDAFSPHIKNLSRVVELAGGEISGLVFSPLVASRAALSRAQKELGTVLIDVGSGTTGMSVYEENKLIGVAKFPLGSANVSNDLAVGLKIPVSAAESLKLGYGYALAKDVSIKDHVDMKKFYPEAKGPASRKFISEIIEVRLAEILDFVNNELKLLGKYGNLPGGAVLVGGGAKIPGLTDLVRQELRVPSQIGLPIEDDWQLSNESLREPLEDPEYIVSLGLVLYGMDGEGWQIKNPLSQLSIRNALKYFIP